MPAFTPVHLSAPGSDLLFSVPHPLPALNSSAFCTALGRVLRHLWLQQLSQKLPPGTSFASSAQLSYLSSQTPLYSAATSLTCNHSVTHIYTCRDMNIFTVCFVIWKSITIEIREPTFASSRCQGTWILWQVAVIKVTKPHYSIISHLCLCFLSDMFITGFFFGTGSYLYLKLL